MLGGPESAHHTFLIRVYQKEALKLPIPLHITLLQTVWSLEFVNTFINQTIRITECSNVIIMISMETGYTPKMHK